MPEDKIQSRIRLGEVFGPARAADPQQAPTPSQYDQMYAALKQNLDTKNLLLLSSVADNGVGGKPTPVPDAIEQVSKFNQAIGINVGELLKEQKAAQVAAEQARTQAEKVVADMKYEMITRAIADTRAQSEAILKEVRDLLQNKPKSHYLFGAADEATEGQFTKQHLAKLFGQPSAPVDPFQQALATMAQIEQFKEQIGLSRPAPQERVPLSENPEYHRMLLEDKRLALKDQQILEIEKKKADTLSTFIAMLPGAISDAAAAWGAKFGGGKKEQPASAPAPSKAPAQQQAIEYIPITCPNPACKRTIPWPKEAQAGAVGECPYCHMGVQNDGEGEEKK
jgi:hypothetical protein